MYKVYKITNLINNKIYIGVTKNLLKYRFSEHSKTNSHIGFAIRKYGKDNFAIEEIYNFETKDAAYSKEAEIVNEEFIKRENTYNKKEGGFGGWGFKSTGLIVVKDKLGNTSQVSVNDKKYLNGELVHHTKGTITVKDNTGKSLRVDESDERFLSGELVGVTKGRKDSEETKRKKSEFGKTQTGYKSSRALYIEIYDNKDNLQYICEGNYKIVIKENKLPQDLSKATKDKPYKGKINKQYNGWYCLRKGRLKDIKNDRIKNAI